MEQAEEQISYRQNSMATPQEINFFRSQEFQELLNRYEQAIKEKETPYFEIDDLSDILSYYIYAIRFKEAERVVTIAERLFRNSIELVKMEARLMLCTGNPEQALGHLSRYEYMNDNEIRRLQAEALLFIKDFESAKNIALTILRESENDPESIHDSLSIIMECGYASEAMAFCDSLLKSNPMDKNMLEIKAECLTDMQRTDEAIKIYNTLLDEDPYNTSYWERLGHIYYCIGRYAKSLECYEYHNAILDGLDYVKIMQGYCYFQLRNYKAARELFAWCCDNSPELSLQSIFYTALSHYYEGNREKALDTFEQFIGLSRENSIEITLARIDRAIILDELGEHGRAEETISLALFMVPQNIEQLLLTGKHLYEPRDSENVTYNDMDIFEKREWTLNEEIFILGQHLVNHKHLQPARRVFEFLIKNGYEDSDIHAYLAYIIFMTDEKEKALKHVEYAVNDKSDILFELFGIPYSNSITAKDFIKK